MKFDLQPPVAYPVMRLGEMGTLLGLQETMKQRKREWRLKRKQTIN
jgi:hypothetical protein